MTNLIYFFIEKMYSYKILQNWTKDLFHSSIVVFDKKSYLFNCCDGTQRNMSQQNIRFNKIGHIFFNSSSIDSYLGSYGFYMSRNDQVGVPLPSKTKEDSNKNPKEKPEKDFPYLDENN